MNRTKKIQEGSTSDSWANKIYELDLPYMVLTRDDFGEPYNNCSDEQFKALRDTLQDILINEWEDSLEVAISSVFGD